MFYETHRQSVKCFFFLLCHRHPYQYSSAVTAPVLSQPRPPRLSRQQVTLSSSDECDTTSGEIDNYFSCMCLDLSINDNTLRTALVRMRASQRVVCMQLHQVLIKEDSCESAEFGPVDDRL
jgi:hypothetical protein